jgi:phage head maturation protease
VAGQRRPDPDGVRALWNDPTHIIGSADPNDVREDAKSFFVKAMLDIEDNPTAKTVFGQIRRRVVKEASFAYDVVREQKAKDGANNLIELSIIEVRPCLKGMNPEAGGFSTKSNDLQGCSTP